MRPSQSSWLRAVPVSTRAAFGGAGAILRTLLDPFNLDVTAPVSLLILVASCMQCPAGVKTTHKRRGQVDPAVARETSVSVAWTEVLTQLIKDSSLRSEWHF